MEPTDLPIREQGVAAAERPADAIVARIPFTDLGTSGPRLVFLHANAYPPECYQALLSELSAENRIWAMHQRPLWAGSRPDEVDSWHPLSEDLLRFLDERGAEKVIAVGHSMGAIVALRAAILAPTRFGCLVLLDPVLMSKRTMAEWRLVRNASSGHWLHAKIASASRRQRSFVSLEEAFRGYRRHRVFRHMSDRALGTLIAGLTAPDTNGRLVLRYSPEWEARMYHTAVWNDGDLWDGIPQLEIPTLVMQGAESDTFTDSTCRALRTANPSIRIELIQKSSHLVPFEQPVVVHETIRAFLSDLGQAPN